MNDVLTEFGAVLAESRRRGLPFAVAWRRAMKVVRIERENMDPTMKANMKDWRIALDWSRPFFQASYERRATSSSPPLTDALSSRLRAGDVARVA